MPWYREYLQVYNEYDNIVEKKLKETKAQISWARLSNWLNSCYHLL